MRTSYSLALFLVSAFALGVLAGNGVTLEESAAQGFAGIVSGGNNKNAKTDEPLGYKGVIPGYVPGSDEKGGSTGTNNAPRAAQAPALERQPAKPFMLLPPEARVAQRMTAVPGYAPPQAPLTIDQIQLFAQGTPPLGRPVTSKDIPPELVSTLKNLLTPEQKAILAKPRLRLNGLVPRDAAMQKQVDALVSIVSAPGLNPDQRRENARKAREKLEDYSNYLRLQDQIPADVYTTMGLPDNYVHDTRESTKLVLARVESALQTVKKYEK